MPSGRATRASRRAAASAAADAVDDSGTAGGATVAAPSPPHPAPKEATVAIESITTFEEVDAIRGTKSTSDNGHDDSFASSGDPGISVTTSTDRPGVGETDTTTPSIKKNREANYEKLVERKRQIEGRIKVIEIPDAPSKKKSKKSNKSFKISSSSTEGTQSSSTTTTSGADIQSQIPYTPKTDTHWDFVMKGSTKKFETVRPRRMFVYLSSLLRFATLLIFDLIHE